jgi:hypothetical protein
MPALPVSLPGFGRPDATRHEMLAMVALDDRTLRDIGVRRTDLYAVPAQLVRHATARRPGVTRLNWRDFVSRLLPARNPEPVPCC